MTALAATARYELWMQLRKPAIWIATVLPFALYALFAVLGNDSTGLQRYRYETSPKVWMVDALGWFVPVLPMIFGIVLADRLVRDRRLGVAELLDATPANPSARLVGKYLGVCAATAVPVALLCVAVALGFTVWRGQPAALWWAWRPSWSSCCRCCCWRGPCRSWAPSSCPRPCSACWSWRSSSGPRPPR